MAGIERSEPSAPAEFQARGMREKRAGYIEQHPEGGWLVSYTRGSLCGCDDLFATPGGIFAQQYFKDKISAIQSLTLWVKKGRNLSDK